MLATGAALAVHLAATHSNSPAPERSAVRIYVVRAGDTIWGIARRQAGPREDLRPLVDRLIRVNHLRAAHIWPGQQLVLPS